MEPADLNTSANTNDDARLEALLRRAAPELSDHGFSARVLAALPAVTESHTPALSRRLVVCIVGAGAGCGLVLWRGVSGTELESGADRLGDALVNLGPSLADPLFTAALGVTLFSLVVAFRAELRHKLRS